MKLIKPTHSGVANEDFDCKNPTELRTQLKEIQNFILDREKRIIYITLKDKILGIGVPFVLNDTSEKTRLNLFFKQPKVYKKLAIKYPNPNKLLISENGSTYLYFRFDKKCFLKLFDFIRAVENQSGNSDLILCDEITYITEFMSSNFNFWFNYRNANNQKRQLFFKYSNDTFEIFDLTTDVSGQLKYELLLFNKLNYNISYAAVFSNDNVENVVYKNQLERLFQHSLVELDDQFNLHIKNFVIKEDSKNEILFQVEAQAVVPLEELLCLNPELPLKESNVKGIFHKQNYIYILLNFHFIVIRVFEKYDEYTMKSESDLIVNFNYKNSHSYPAKKYEFDTVNWYELLNLKPVKISDLSFLFQIHDQYYVGNFLYDEMFRFNLDGYNLEKIKEKLVDCPYQILLVKSFYFCFTEQDYYLIGEIKGDQFKPKQSPHHLIKNIFKDEPSIIRIFEKDQRLLYIFHYEFPEYSDFKGKKIKNFMFLNEIVRLDVKLHPLETLEKDNYEIKFKNLDTSFKFVINHCLFDSSNCP